MGNPCKINIMIINSLRHPIPFRTSEVWMRWEKSASREGATTILDLKGLR